jgi:hypothetical protein
MWTDNHLDHCVSHRSISGKDTAQADTDEVGREGLHHPNIQDILLQAEADELMFLRRYQQKNSVLAVTAVRRVGDVKKNILKSSYDRAWPERHDLICDYRVHFRRKRLRCRTAIEARKPSHCGQERERSC